MDEVVVAVMAVVMIGAAIWGWRIENLPDADQKTKKSDHSENGVNILVRQSRLSGFIRATVPVIGSHQKCYAAKGSLHE